MSKGIENSVSHSLVLFSVTSGCDPFSSSISDRRAHLRIPSSSGFTLLEVMVTIGITLLLALGGLKLIQDTMTEFKEINESEAVASYNQDLRGWLKKSTASGEPLCMAKLRPLMDDTKLNSMITQVTSPTDPPLEIDLAEVNLLDSDSNRFGSFNIKNSSLDQFVLIQSNKGFRLSEPKEISSVDLANQVVTFYIVSAKLNTYFETFNTTSVPKTLAELKLQKDIKKSVTQLSLAIMITDEGPLLVDCGRGSLARTTAVIDACKALGPDFEYFFDRSAYQIKDSSGNFSTGSQSTLNGQCYLPIYDPLQQATTPFIINGTNAAQITGYTPFRGFLCEPSLAGRSVDFSFCTGMN